MERARNVKGSALRMPREKANEIWVSSGAVCLYSPMDGLFGVNVVGQFVADPVFVKQRSVEQTRELGEIAVLVPCPKQFAHNAAES